MAGIVIPLPLALLPLVPLSLALPPLVLLPLVPLPLVLLPLMLLCHGNHFHDNRDIVFLNVKTRHSLFLAVGFYL